MKIVHRADTAAIAVDATSVDVAAAVAVIFAETVAEANENSDATFRRQNMLRRLALTKKILPSLPRKATSP
jgi:hypothetical protein